MLSLADLTALLAEKKFDRLLSKVRMHAFSDIRKLCFGIYIKGQSLYHGVTTTTFACFKLASFC